MATGNWDARHPAVHVERLAGEDGSVKVAMLRHPTYPYTESVAADADGLEAALRDSARRYIALVAEVAGLGAAGARLLAEEPAEPGFGWLDITWDGRGGGDPRLSFWVERRPGRKAVDRTLVLLAGNQLRQAGRQLCAGMATGLRVVMHVDPASNGQVRVRVTGLSVCGLASAALPAAGNEDVDALLDAAHRDLAAAHGLAPGSVTLTGFAAVAPHTLRLSCSGRRGDGHASRTYTWSTLYQGAKSAGRPGMQHSRLVEHVSCMAAPARALRLDPHSMEQAREAVKRRPTGLATKLNPFRLPDGNRGGPGEPTVGPIPLLASDAKGKLFEVRQSPLADRHARAQETQRVPFAELDLRSDDMAAVHAYERGQELFGRLATYGLAPRGMFKFAALPLVLRHRAAFANAPDGNAVNAQVRPSGATPDFRTPYTARAWPRLEVAFGAANLTHRQVLPNASGQLRAQALGLAADARWAWHEFGHVLLAASTGELEFRFAHSAGDALAAIVADPDLQLEAAADPQNPDDERLRLLTFPGVQLTRSHGRQAALGWCWCGRRSRRRHRAAALAPHRFSDYFEEQLLSSSLFTLYSAIGGHPEDNAGHRHAASHYCVYLVMRATALLGPASVVPARSADQFVSALIDADIGTVDWDIDPSPLGRAAAPIQRAGGTVHKVVRWAFEHQGLYATDDPQAEVDGVGRPPLVDIYIAGCNGRAGGGYAPVPLTWCTDPQAAAPGWHAAAEALWQERGQVRVSVSNRGELPAGGVTAACWVAQVGPGPLAWLELSPTAQPQQGATVGPQAIAPFSFTASNGAAPLKGDCFVLVQATCAADRANLDPAAQLACSSGKPPAEPERVTDLVANDNNLGLRVIRFE
ncbi:MAG: hypothetical protein Q8K45_00720 [Rubrivivax sp.]|nr:hypothetical protein [Rubrivivax sp.]